MFLIIVGDLFNLVASFASDVPPGFWSARKVIIRDMVFLVSVLKDCKAKMSFSITLPTTLDIRSCVSIWFMRNANGNPPKHKKSSHSFSTGRSTVINSLINSFAVLVPCAKFKFLVGLNINPRMLPAIPRGG